MAPRVLPQQKTQTEIYEKKQTLKTNQPRPAGETAKASDGAKSTIDVAAVFSTASQQHMAFLKNVFQRLRSGEPLKNVREAASRILNTFLISARYVGAQQVVSSIENMTRLLESDEETPEAIGSKGLAHLNDIEKFLALQTGKTDQQPAASPQPDPFSDIRYADIRVPSNKIDALMDMVTELMIAKNSLNYLIQKGSPHSLGDEWLHQGKRIAGDIDTITMRLQDMISNLRLMKFSGILDRLPRIVREIARTADKKVQLLVSGGDIEADRKVIEFLVDPLVHIIRNAVDHGIEPPERRLERGKPELGTIQVAVEQQGKYVIVEIRDDGAGLDEQAIRDAALRKQLATAETLDAMSRGELLNLVFASGFSTSHEITHLSGRGVGLDVVKNNVKALGGNVTLASEPGQGTTVTIQAPLALAVMDVLLTEVDGETYAIPLSAVVETIRIAPHEIQVLNNREVILYHGEVLALTDLGVLLGTRRQARLTTRVQNELLHVVLIAFGGHVRAVVADKIIRPEEILAKPLESKLYNVRELAGAAMLGDGTIVLVLDQMGLF
jgi:two-component system chemotaxis sensor kinase CheA